MAVAKSNTKPITGEQIAEIQNNLSHVLDGLQAIQQLASKIGRNSQVDTMAVCARHMAGNMHGLVRKSLDIVDAVELRHG